MTGRAWQWSLKELEVAFIAQQQNCPVNAGQF
jgi:hypothetical protein